MAAKRYRDSDHRSFHRAAAYAEGRSVKRSRDERALKRKSTWGRIVAAGEWAIAEWDALKRLWALGAAVPYPVQIDGTEILMEWITVDGETAPRLAQTRPDPELLASYYDQVRDFLALMVQDGIVHGDLSAYNILAAGERLVVIDLPQIVDLVGNPNGMDFLLRDCTNICGWFKARGLEVDEQELFGELMAHAFWAELWFGPSAREWASRDASARRPGAAYPRSPCVEHPRRTRNEALVVGAYVCSGELSTG